MGAAVLALSALAITFFLINLRRAGERAGRAAERRQIQERTDVLHRQMLDAARNRPRSRDALLDRLHDGSF